MFRRHSIMRNRPSTRCVIGTCSSALVRDYQKYRIVRGLVTSWRRAGTAADIDISVSQLGRTVA